MKIKSFRLGFILLLASLASVSSKRKDEEMMKEIFKSLRSHPKAVGDRVMDFSNEAKENPKTNEKPSEEVVDDLKDVSKELGTDSVCSYIG